MVIDLTKTGAVDALPLCGLIEAVAEMFIEINFLNEGPMIINTDHITVIEYNKVFGCWVINLDLVAEITTEKDDEESEGESLWKEKKKFLYKKIHFISDEVYNRIKEKLLAEK